MTYPLTPTVLLTIGGIALLMNVIFAWLNHIRIEPGCVWILLGFGLLGLLMLGHP